MGFFNLFKKKTSQVAQVSQKPEIENSCFDNIEPLNINSVVEVCKGVKPDAPEEEIATFVARLAEPKEDLEHLTEDGDLPWGWHTAHKKDIERIERKYKRCWQAWIDNRHNSPTKYSATLEDFVKCMRSIKSQCEKKGECFDCWRDELFTDDFLQVRSDELEELKQNLADLEKAYQAKIDFELTILPTLESNLTQTIKTSPGILQRDIYKNFSPECKSYIQEKLYYMAKENKISREKCGNSYKLYIK